MRANAVPFEGNHAKSFNGNITEHVWGLFGLLFNCLSQSLPDFLRNSRHGHNYLDRVGGSTRCFRTLHYSSALEAVAQSSGREWGCLKPFSNYSRLHADISLSRTVNSRFFSEAQLPVSLNSRHLILQRYRAISSRVPVNPLDEGKEPVLTAVGRYVAWNPNFQRQNPCIPGQSFDCPLWTSQSCMNQFYPILSFVSQSDEAGPISQEAIKCASIRQRPSSPSSKDLPQRKSTGSLSIY